MSFMADMPPLERVTSTGSQLVASLSTPPSAASPAAVDSSSASARRRRPPQYAMRTVRETKSKKKKKSRPSTPSGAPASSSASSSSPGGAADSDSDSLSSDSDSASEAAAEEGDEDTSCTVCGNDLDEIIIECKECKVRTHPSCYGIDVNKLPGGGYKGCSIPPFTCLACHRGLKPVCILCGHTGGALKPTEKEGTWGHIDCGLFIPELWFEDQTKMNLIQGFDYIPPMRANLKCKICQRKVGYCIQCDYQAPTEGHRIGHRCTSAFHVSCAKRAKSTGYRVEFHYTPPLDPNQGDDYGVAKVCFCAQHMDAVFDVDAWLHAQRSMSAEDEARSWETLRKQAATGKGKGKGKKRKATATSASMAATSSNESTPTKDSVVTADIGAGRSNVSLSASTPDHQAHKPKKARIKAETPVAIKTEPNLIQPHDDTVPAAAAAAASPVSASSSALSSLLSPAPQIGNLNQLMANDISSMSEHQIRDTNTSVAAAAFTNQILSDLDASWSSDIDPLNASLEYSRSIGRDPSGDSSEHDSSHEFEMLAYIAAQQLSPHGLNSSLRTPTSASVDRRSFMSISRSASEPDTSPIVTPRAAALMTPLSARTSLDGSEVITNYTDTSIASDSQHHIGVLSFQDDGEPVPAPSPQRSQSEPQPQPESQPAAAVVAGASGSPVPTAPWSPPPPTAAQTRAFIDRFIKKYDIKQWHNMYRLPLEAMAYQGGPSIQGLIELIKTILAERARDAAQAQQAEHPQVSNSNN